LGARGCIDGHEKAGIGERPTGIGSAEGVAATIRAAQADTIRSPEIVRRLRAAGVIAYWVYMTGKKVVYFGRKGETHVELFPGQKQEVMSLTLTGSTLPIPGCRRWWRGDRGGKLPGGN